MLWAGSSPHTRPGHAQLINVRKMASSPGKWLNKISEKTQYHHAFFHFLVFHTFFCAFHRVVVITLIIIKD